MRVLILGDTHAQDDIFLRILAAEKEYDAVLHTGDFEGSEFVYRELSDAPLYAIAGNNDFFTDAPYERVVELEGCRIFMTHGHRYGLEKGYMGIHCGIRALPSAGGGILPGRSDAQSREHFMAQTGEQDSFLHCAQSGGRPGPLLRDPLSRLKKFKNCVDNRCASNYNNTCI